MMHAVISGTGSYLPRQVLSNDELAAQLDTSHDWIISRTGIASRHVADPLQGETTALMAGYAAEKALAASGVALDEIDLIIAATCTPDQFFPTTACFVKHFLKIKRPVPAFDLGAACSGFLYAMDTANQYIATQKCRNVLIVGSERMSQAVNWEDRSTCILFGDGAGACVISTSERPGIIASQMHSEYDAQELLRYNNRNAGNAPEYVSMRGNEVFKLAVNIMGDIVEDILTANGFQKSDLNWLIPHQANIRIIQAIAKKLNMPMSQVIVTLETQGNTSAASIPIALDYAIRNQQVVRGDLILLESFGGGMTWGASLVKY